MKEKIKKPKCKGIWRLVIYAGTWCYQCSKCGERVTINQSHDPVNHKDVK